MDTYFARHTRVLDIDDKTRNRLWEERRVAIHFPGMKTGKLGSRDNQSLMLSDYSGAAYRATHALLRLAEGGGYICSEHYPHQECLLGYVPPNSKVELLRGKWGIRNDYEGREAILKSLKLEKVRIMQRSDLALVLVGRPRQGTIMRWPSAKDSIESLVEGRKTKPSFDRLSPALQEIMCSEFLRLPKFEEVGDPPYSRLVHLLLPVGRSMRDVDICGITSSGRVLFAQVTFHKLEGAQAQEKLKVLATYGDAGDNLLTLFCDCKDVSQQGGVRIIPVRWVYEYFTSTPSGQTWLRRAVTPLSFVG